MLDLVHLGHAPLPEQPNDAISTDRFHLRQKVIRMPNDSMTLRM